MQVLNVQNVPGCFNIAIVISRFNQDVTKKLHEGALKRLKELGFSDDRITLAWVPGAVEIPITAQRFASSGKFEAIVCLGAVIYGETKHFDYVCQQVSQGCQTVALKHDIPVIFGVLTTNTLEQALDRVGGKKGNMGEEAINTAYEMVSILSQIKE